MAVRGCLPKTKGMLGLYRGGLRNGKLNPPLGLCASLHFLLLELFLDKVILCLVTAFPRYQDEGHRGRTSLVTAMRGEGLPQSLL